MSKINTKHQHVKKRKGYLLFKIMVTQIGIELSTKTQYQCLFQSCTRNLGEANLKCHQNKDTDLSLSAYMNTQLQSR